MSAWKEFSKGILKENPVLLLVIGLCPALAVSSTATDGLGMGIATLFVLLMSNIVVSVLRKHIPGEIRIPIFIIIISTFVTIIDYVMHAYQPELYASLGVFVPLIVVNCLVLGRAEAFASKNGTWLAIVDGLGMGLGFTLTLTVLGVIREILGNGTLEFFGYSILNFGEGFKPALVMIMPPGAFLTLGFLMALQKRLNEKK
jgi:electron transport complex protein RnfE